MASLEINESGFTVLYEARDPSVDIIFIHGFTGHPRRTWTYKNTTQHLKHHREDTSSSDKAHHPPKHRGSLFRRRPLTVSSSSTISDQSIALNIALSCNQQREVFWPQDLLPQDVPDSRVLTYGYDTRVRHLLFQGPTSQSGVYQLAWDFLNSLAAWRRQPGRPILFVAHSLGGIIVKEALRRSRGAADASPTAHLKDVFDATTGVVFFGTPHRGADPRGMVHHVLQAALTFVGVKANDQVVDTLMPNAERLAELNDEFPHMCHRKSWRVYSFQEQYGLRSLMDRKVVEDASSCLDDPLVEVKQPIASNHMDMCRFGGPQDPGYIKAADAIVRILEWAQKNKRLTVPDQNIIPTESGASIESATLNGAQKQPFDMEEPPPRAGHDISDDIKQQLIDNLCFDQIDERLTNLAPAFKSTCQWFFEKEDYQKWHDAGQSPDQSGFLWIKGNPGTGKSTLMKVLFERAISETSRNPEQICLSFFFNARGVVEEKSSTGLYRSLLHQLFQKAESLADASFRWMTPDGARGVARSGWNEQALKQTMARAVEKLDGRSLSIFVDALDECDQQQAADMVGHFEELCERAREIQVRLRICLSSRHYPSITIQHGIETVLEEQQGHKEDIEAFIKSKLRLGGSKGAVALRGEILSKSSQIFLWVALVVDIINAEFRNPSAASIKRIQARVQEIPPKLHDLFEMILTRDGENLDQLRICLHLILFVFRPLGPEELYFAVQLGLDPKCSSRWDLDDVELEWIKKFVRTSSKGLTEVTRSKSAKVQFIHESVRDFLLGRYGDRWSGAAGNIEGRGHELLRNCCLAQLNDTIDGVPVYLSLAIAMKETRVAVQTKYPFLTYAIANILKHSDQAQRRGLEQGPFLDRFPLTRWVHLKNTLEMYNNRRYTTSVSLLYILAEMNAPSLIALDPQAGRLSFAVEKERYGTPMFAAMASGSAGAARALVEAQLQTPAPIPELRDLCRRLIQERGNFPSEYLSFDFSPKRDLLSQIDKHCGELVMAAALLYMTANVEIESHEQLFCAALRATSIGDYPITAQALLDAALGIEWDAYSYGGPPLRAAAEYGHLGATKMLLEKGVNVDEGDANGQTPVSFAAKAGHEAVVKMLLEANANIEAKDDLTGQTPLSWAAEGGHVGVVKLFLDAHANVETADHRRIRTALSLAAEKGRESVVKLLLKANANIDAEDVDDRTPLSWAAEHGSKELIRLLLDSGADIEARDRWGRTPLMYAARFGNMPAIAVFLEEGALVDAADQRGDTAVTIASEAGLLDAVGLLISYMR